MARKKKAKKKPLWQQYKDVSMGKDPVRQRPGAGPHDPKKFTKKDRRKNNRVDYDIPDDEV